MSFRLVSAISRNETGLLRGILSVAAKDGYVKDDMSSRLAVSKSLEL